MNDGKIPLSADGSIPRQSMDCKIVVMSKLTDSETSRQVACLQTALMSETDFLWGRGLSVVKASALHAEFQRVQLPSVPPGRVDMAQ